MELYQSVSVYPKYLAEDWSKTPSVGLDPVFCAVQTSVDFVVIIVVTNTVTTPVDVDSKLF